MLTRPAIHRHFLGIGPSPYPRRAPHVESLARSARTGRRRILARADPVAEARQGRTGPAPGRRVGRSGHEPRAGPVARGGVPTLVAVAVRNGYGNDSRQNGPFVSNV